MKISICTSPLKTASKTRGVGVYTRELISAFRTSFPKDKMTETTGNPYIAKSDLVHYPFFDPYFLTLPWHYRCPTIITIHDLIPLKYPTHFPAGYRGRFKWWIQRFRASRASAIITDSRSSAADIHTILGIPEERIFVVPLSSATSRTSYAITSKLKKLYNLPDKYILYVGDLNWNKNLPGLINAFSKLSDQSIHLVLVGKSFRDKPDIPEYKAIANSIESSGKKDQINMIGYVPSHHLGGIYRGATLYVQPSWDEGFGLPILEAMKAGCPVLSSNQGSLPEVGGAAAAYFDPHKDNLADSIHQLLSSSSKRSAMMDAGLIQVKNFSWAKTAQATMGVYKKVISEEE